MNRSAAGRRRAQSLSFLCLIFAVCGLIVPAAALAGGEIEGLHDGAFPDFDARTGTIAPTSTQRQLVAGMGARATWNDFGTPHTLVKDGGFLATGVAGANAVAAAKNWLNANRALFRLASVDGLVLHNDSRLARSYGHAVTFRQKFGSLDAWPDGIVTVGLTGTPKAGWKVAHVSSTLTGATSLTGSAAISLQEAWQRAAMSVGHSVSVTEIGGIVRRDAGLGFFRVGSFAQLQSGRPVALVTAAGVIPAYEVDVRGLPSSERRPAVVAYSMMVDARNGTVVTRKNLVHQFHQNNGPQTFTGSTGTLEAACGQEHTFSVAANTESLDIGAFAEQPQNDIVLVLKKGVVELRRENSSFAIGARPRIAPEAIHYAPPGGVPAGNDYAVQVCDDPTPPAPAAPGNYRITVVINDLAPLPGAGVPYPPVWRVFPANPKLHTLPQDPWANPSDDIRKLWCWASITGCNEVVRNLASRYPWDVDTFTETPTFTTRGNNAVTAEAWTTPLSPGPFGQRPASANRSYSFAWTNAWFTSDCSQTQLVPQGNDINAAVTNLFAMHNRMHDWSYHLGFTEQNWNMQANNFGNVPPPPPRFQTPINGGQGDAVIGQSQAGALDGGWPDYLGRDNANMLTERDGIPPSTNMYLWQPLAAGFYAPCVDGDYDMGIIGHEYGHSIENRMIGKGAFRSGHHAGAMGESNGDQNGMEVQNEHGYVPVTDENRYAVGPYATGNKLRGIRNYGMNYPYWGSFAFPGITPLINPLNFSNLGYDITGGQVHADGEIWTKLNFDIRQALVNKYNGAYPETDKALQKKCANGLVAPEFCPGNRRWMQLVYDSYLLMPSSPTMLQARDAILRADLMRATDPDPTDPNVNSHWPSNQNDLWYQFAYHGFGTQAVTTNAGATPSDTSDLDPKPNFESPNHNVATVVFTSSAPQGGSAGAPKARIYVGHYEARISAIADTDPCTAAVPQAAPAECVGTGTPPLPANSTLRPCNTTANPPTTGVHPHCLLGEDNLDATARFVPGTYEFTAHAPGYGHIRFRLYLAQAGGTTRTVNIAFPTNFASRSNGATIQHTNGTGTPAVQLDLVDDTEATQWERLQPHDPVTGTQPDVEGSQATIDLAGGVQTINRVQVSALLDLNAGRSLTSGGANRFQALRAFEVFVCTVNSNPVSTTNPNPTCNGAMTPVNGVTPGFTRVYRSAANAFPGTVPRPVAPDMVLRSFGLWRQVTATHVQVRVLTNQCTGNPQYQGDQDNDVSGAVTVNIPGVGEAEGHQADCRFGAFPYGTGVEVPIVGFVGLGRAPQRGNVRIAEFQVFGRAGVVGAPVDTLPLDPIVTLTKSGPLTAKPGSSITYKLDYTNLGPESASSAKLVDTLPAGVTYVSSSDGGSYNSTTRKVTWGLGTVAKGVSGSRTLTVKVNASTGVGSVLVNTAEFTAAQTTSPPTGVATTLVVP